MRRKIWFLSLFLAIIISLGVTLRVLGKDEGLQKRGDLSIVSEKIEEILKNQQDIIARLQDIRKELDIIRVRASRR